MKESPGFPRKSSHGIQAVADVGFLASLLNLSAAVEMAAAPESGSQARLLATEVGELVRRRTGTDEPERTF